MSDTIRDIPNIKPKQSAKPKHKLLKNIVDKTLIADTPVEKNGEKNGEKNDLYNGMLELKEKYIKENAPEKIIEQINEQTLASLKTYKKIDYSTEPIHVMAHKYYTTTSLVDRYLTELTSSSLVKKITVENSLTSYVYMSYVGSIYDLLMHSYGMRKFVKSSPERTNADMRIRKIQVWNKNIYLSCFDPIYDMNFTPALDSIRYMFKLNEKYVSHVMDAKLLEPLDPPYKHKIYRECEKHFRIAMMSPELFRVFFKADLVLWRKCLRSHVFNDYTISDKTCHELFIQYAKFYHTINLQVYKLFQKHTTWFQHTCRYHKELTALAQTNVFDYNDAAISAQRLRWIFDSPRHGPILPQKEHIHEMKTLVNLIDNVATSFVVSNRHDNSHVCTVCFVQFRYLSYYIYNSAKDLCVYIEPDTFYGLVTFQSKIPTNVRVFPISKLDQCLNTLDKTVSAITMREYMQCPVHNSKKDTKEDMKEDTKENHTDQSENNVVMERSKLKKSNSLKCKTYTPNLYYKDPYSTYDIDELDDRETSRLLYREKYFKENAKTK